MKKNIEKIMIAVLLGLLIIPMGTLGVRGDEIVKEELSGEKMGEKSIPLGIKFGNQLLVIHDMPNVLGEIITTIDEDAGVLFYEFMANGWVRVSYENRSGYIDGEKLRDTKERIVEEKVEKMPDTSKEKKVAEPILKTYIGNDGIIDPNVKKEAKPAVKEEAVVKAEAPLNTEAQADIAPEQKKEMTFRLSHYTNFLSENGGYTGTASGKPLIYGVIASNIYPFGTKIFLEGYGEMTVYDRGGSHFDSNDRLDVFIPPIDGESRVEYKARVMKLGRKTVKGYVILD